MVKNLTPIGLLTVRLLSPGPLRQSWPIGLQENNIPRKLVVGANQQLVYKGQVALEDKIVYLFQKSVITMKNQVRPICSPKDKIWSRTDKLQRCRRLPVEQAKLRQILENNSEGVLIRKWFDRWYVAGSLCYRLRCKINFVLISQKHESRRGWPIFFRTNIHNNHQDGSILCQVLLFRTNFHVQGEANHKQEPFPERDNFAVLYSALSAGCELLWATNRSFLCSFVKAFESSPLVLARDFVLKCDCSLPDKFFCHWPISSRICPEQIWNCPLVWLGPEKSY